MNVYKCNNKTRAAEQGRKYVDGALVPLPGQENTTPLDIFSLGNIIS